MTNNDSGGPIFPSDDRSTTQHSPTRRGLLIGLIAAAAVAAGGYFTWTRYFFPASSLQPWQAKPSQGPEIALGDVSQFIHSPDPVETPFQAQSVFVDFSSGAPEVLSSICPHRGCVVVWNHAGQHYRCPCHGSQFGRDGSVVRGPAVSPLHSIPCSLVGNVVYAQS